MSTLKPCPFCGMDYAENAWDDYGSEYWVCEFCGAASGTERDEYIWNSRPIEDDLRKRIAELEAENDRLQGAWFKDETICPDGSLKPKVSTLLSRIAELEEKQRWIPVSERLPEDKKHYMTVVMNCFDGSRDVYRLRYYGNGDWFSWSSESNVVTHWKEEPELPEVTE